MKQPIGFMPGTAPVQAITVHPAVSPARRWDDEIAEATQALLDLATATHCNPADPGEAFEECGFCGEWEEHTASCPAPALKAWMAAPPRDSVVDLEPLELDDDGPDDDRPCGDCGRVWPEPHDPDCENAGENRDSGRERDDDDGVQYADPRDERDDRLDRD